MYEEFNCCKMSFAIRFFTAQDCFFNEFDTKNQKKLKINFDLLIFAAN